MTTKAAPPVELPIQMRSGMILNREALKDDPENRTIQLSFASDAAIIREFGLERLSFKPGAMNVERLESGAPLLMDHSWTDQVGKVEKCWIENKKAYASVRFGRSARAEEIFQDVRDGIRTSTSFAYIVNEMQRVHPRRSGQEEEWIVTRYTPIEISLVSVPADHHVGTDRSGQTSFAVRTLVDRSPMIENAAESDGTADLPPVIGDSGIEVVREKTRGDELKRTKLILEVARRFQCMEAAETAIRDGTSVGDFEHHVLVNVLRAKPLNLSASQQGIGWGEKERRSYSLLKAIKEALTPGGLTGLEREASETIERALGSTIAHSQRRTLNFGSGSFFMPTDLPMRAGPRIDQRMDVTETANAGAQFVAEQFLGDQFIAYLRASLQVRAAGATILDGLQGMIVIPKVVGPTTAYWLGEIDPVVPSDVITSAVAMQPRRLSSMSILSRQLDYPELTSGRRHC